MEKAPYPKSVIIETTLRCNLRCIHCVSHLRRVKHNADMAPGILEMIWPLAEQAEDISLDNQGEFFCNRNYLPIFRRARDTGKRTTITTNGKLIGEEIIDNVFFGGLTNLNFSIDGINAKTHERLRVGSDYEKLMALLRKTCERKRNSISDLPHIGINMVIRRENIEQLPAMVKLARELGVERMNVFHFFAWKRSLEMECLFHHKGLSDRYVGIAEEQNRDSGMELCLTTLFAEDAKHGRRRFRKCDYPFSAVTIGADGEVFACCDWRMVMGNLNEASFDDIWNGERYRQLRRTVNSTHPQTICANCCVPFVANTANPAAFFKWEMPQDD